MARRLNLVKAPTAASAACGSTTTAHPSLNCQPFKKARASRNKSQEPRSKNQDQGTKIKKTRIKTQIKMRARPLRGVLFFFCIQFRIQNQAAGRYDRTNVQLQTSTDCVVCCDDDGAGRLHFAGAAHSIAPH